MYRFLASTRWVGWLLMVTVFAAVCGGLSWWQWDRRAETAAQNAQVSANWDARPTADASAQAWFGALAQENTYRQVTLTGEYLPKNTVFARRRTVGDTLGMEVLVPFKTRQGAMVVVDRGWLPNGDSTEQTPDPVPAPPAGNVTVTVRMMAAEPHIGDAPDGQIASIDLAGMASRTGLPLSTGAYGLMVSEDPTPAVVPTPLPKPEADEGMHWSYAFQWAAFGILFFVGFGYAAKQQAKLNREDREAAAAAAAAGTEVIHSARRAPRPKPIKPRRDGQPHDEEIEDALIDAAER